MASEPEAKIDPAKADAAAEKAYAAAAGEVNAKMAPVVDTPVVAADPPKTDAPKIDKAVAAIKATPRKKVASKKVAAKRFAAPVTRTVAKAAPAKKPVVKAAPKKIVKKTDTTQTSAPRIPAVAQLKDKIMATAKTTTTDYTAKAKEFAADTQTRAKAAFDKLQGYTGEMTEFTKGNVEALVESGKILGAGLQDMARGEIEAAKSAFETATADVKAIAAVKSPTELFKVQGEIARRNFDALVARASKNAEISMKLANDAFAPISSRLSLAAEKISTAA